MRLNRVPYWRYSVHRRLKSVNVALPPELERIVADKVASGRYASSNDVIRAALSLLDERDREEAARLEALRRDIQAGLDSGPARPFDASKLKHRLGDSGPSR
jgi:antitoxin ParD1/3/4